MNALFIIALIIVVVVNVYLLFLYIRMAKHVGDIKGSIKPSSKKSLMIESLIGNDKNVKRQILDRFIIKVDAEVYKKMSDFSEEDYALILKDLYDEFEKYDLDSYIIDGRLKTYEQYKKFM